MINNNDNMKNNKEYPIVGLYGIGGLYNYGCEAIVKGTEIILKQRWPNVHIKYASIRPEDDKKRLASSNVEVIERQIYKQGSLKWVKSKVNSLFGSITGAFSEDLSWIEHCDIIFSIGGDIYTIPPYTNQKCMRPYYHGLVHFGELVKKKDKKLVIWGASIGPFEANLKAKNIFERHLKKVDLITVREPWTQAYLKSLGINQNVVSCADPAFTLQLSKKPENNRIKTRIAINLSPLSALYIYGNGYDMDLVLKQANMIAQIVNKFEAEVLLIPHVICDFNPLDDDYRYLQAVEASLPENVRDQVTLIDDDPGFLGIKQIIVTCDLVIASRMHCAVNASASGVPTIFLAYSKKAIGMSQYVYGSNDWVVDLSSLTSNDFLQVVNSMLTKKQLIRNSLIKSNPRFQNDALNVLGEVEKLLN